MVLGADFEEANEDEEEKETRSDEYRKVLRRMKVLGVIVAAVVVMGKGVRPYDGRCEANEDGRATD